MFYGDAPYGEYEYGGFNLDDALSVLDALDTLLSSPWLPRSWWLRARPRDASTSTDPPTLLPVNLSTDGHRTFPSDAEELQLPAAIITPYALSFLLESELWGQAATDFGEIVIDDAAGSRRNLAAEDWVGRDADVYIGPRGGTQVQFAKVAQLITRHMRYTRSQLVLIADDFGYIFDRPLQTNFYTGGGGLEGGAEIADQPKPLLLGRARQFTPILVDGTNFVYQIHDGAFDAVSVVRDEGVAIAFNADVADITASVPPAGTFNSSLAAGYIKLDSGGPTGKITCEADGHNSSPFGYVDDIAGLLKLLAVTFAGLADPANIDPVAFTTLASRTAIMGEYFTAPVTIREAMNVFHQSAASWGWLKPNKVLTVGRITDPDAASVDFSLSTKDIHNEPWEVDPFEIPVGRIFVGYRRYDTRMVDTELAAAVPVATRKDYAQEYRFVKAEDAPTFVQIPEAAEIIILTNLDSAVDAQSLADEQLAMRKELRSRATFAPRTGLISRGIGDTFELTDDRLPSSPKKWTIIDVDNVAAAAGQDDRITFTCYG